jgi:endonuclease-3
MAGKPRGGGPRQPLSRARPKAAGSRTGRPAKAARSTAATRPRADAKGIRPGAPGTKARKRSSTTTGGRRRDGTSLLEHAAIIIARLRERYPDARCELDFGDAWQLLVATILSAQCTDRRVNMVTPGLFRAYPTPATMAAARQGDIEEIIRSTGFFRNKARNLIAMAGAVTDRHGGRVPASMDQLVTLPGVGRKTANVVLGNACAVQEGIAVDTHVLRVGRRLGLTTEEDPVKVERDLMGLVDRDLWTLISHLLIWHGRRTCHARKPLCGECPLADICPSSLV